MLTHHLSPDKGEGSLPPTIAAVGPTRKGDEGGCCHELWRRGQPLDGGRLRAFLLPSHLRGERGALCRPLPIVYLAPSRDLSGMVGSSAPTLQVDLVTAMWKGSFHISPICDMPPGDIVVLRRAPSGVYSALYSEMY